MKQFQYLLVDVLQNLAPKTHVSLSWAHQLGGLESKVVTLTLKHKLLILTHPVYRLQNRENYEFNKTTKTDGILLQNTLHVMFKTKRHRWCFHAAVPRSCDAVLQTLVYHCRDERSLQSSRAIKVYREQRTVYRSDLALRRSSCQYPEARQSQSRGEQIHLSQRGVKLTIFTG